MKNKFDTSELRGDLRYQVSVDYTRVSDCDAAGCDFICRCSRLEDLRVDSVYYDGLVTNILSTSKYNKKTKQIERDETNLLVKYCLERILKNNKDLNDPDSWDVSTTHGYYGDEVGTVKLVPGIADRIAKLLISLEDASESALVEQALIAEYSYLDEKLKDKTWSVQRVRVDDLKLNQREYASNLNKDRIREYESTFNHSSVQEIAAVVVNESGYYRVIDGYHRVTALNNLGKQKAWVLVGE